MAATPEMKAAVQAHVATVKAALAPWASDRGYFNFSDKPMDDAAPLYTPETYRGLQWVKTAYDPGELFRASHPVKPAGRR